MRVTPAALKLELSLVDHKMCFGIISINCEVRTENCNIFHYILKKIREIEVLRKTSIPQFTILTVMHLNTELCPLLLQTTSCTQWFLLFSSCNLYGFYSSIRQKFVTLTAPEAIFWAQGLKLLRCDSLKLACRASTMLVVVQLLIVAQIAKF